MLSHTTPTNLLDPIEKASRDEVTALQTRRLKATLHNVYQNVPHYRQAFDAAGVHPDDVKALADLAKHDPDKKEVTEALADICEPSGLHCQAPVFA